MPKHIRPSLSRGKDSKAGTWEWAAEEGQSGPWQETEKFIKQRERKDKLEVRPLRMKGASFGVGEHTSAACRPHVAADSPPVCSVSIKSPTHACL